MIKIDNYKAFHGVMRITPRSMIVPEFEIEADWLYKPEYKCWYGNGASYGEDICTVVSDDAEKQIPKKPDLEADGYDDNGELVYDTGFCPNCRHEFEVYYDASKCCPNCGQALDWGNDS